MKKFTIEEIREKGTIIFEVYRGSYAYGTYIEGKSDMDKAGVYIMPLEYMLEEYGLYDKASNPQVSDEKNDEVYYELGRFLQLLATNNPTMLELLNVADDCIIYKHPIMDEILKHKDKFITKLCKQTFGGYVKQQLAKASGLGKKMNMKKEDKVRKSPLDFIYAPNKQGSQLITKWLSDRGLKQEYCGLVELKNMRFSYGLYYDHAQHLQFEKPQYDSDEFWKHAVKLDERFPTKVWYETFLTEFKNLKFKGIVKNILTSNDISTCQVPKNEEPLTIVQFNKDGYQQHCKEWKEYEVWLAERNTARYVDVENHGQQIDGKNMLHCVRLLRMSKEIAEGKGIIVKRPDFEYLLEIRHGKHDLKSLMEECEATIAVNDLLYDDADLPESVDMDFIKDLLVRVRKKFYNFKTQTFKQYLISLFI